MWIELEFLSKFFNMKGFNGIDIRTGILLFSIIAAASSRALHEDMTIEERAQAFGTTENLPEYEVLPIHYTHVNKRAVNGPVYLELKPFGDHIKLWLEPADGVLFSDETPIYSVSSTSKGPQYALWTDAMKTLAPYIYKNYETYTTLAVNRDANRVRRMAGVIGSKDLVFRPIPTRFAANITRYRRSLDNIPESEQYDHHYHIVYKSATSQAVEPLKNSLRMRRSIQDTVYPEILVIVDHNLYKIFEESWEEMVMYLMAFWNGVDMMYRTLENPKYRFHIRAIIIAEDDKVLDYLSSNRVGSDRVEFNKALNESQYWLFKNLPRSIGVDSYDVAATMTSLVLCKEDSQKGCALGTLGVAYVSGTCRVDEYFHKIIKTAIIHDHGAFTGINTAGHELGHSFGADHDGEESNVRCSDERGNIMAAHTSMTEDLADWSECTLDQFGTFLEKYGKCLHNKPKFGVNLVRLLPGKMRDAHKQCELITGTKAGKVDESTCRALWCVQKDNPNRLRAMGPAADGTPCGDKALCLHGKCIPESMVTY